MTGEFVAAVVHSSDGKQVAETVLLLLAFGTLVTSAVFELRRMKRTETQLAGIRSGLSDTTTTFHRGPVEETQPGFLRQSVLYEGPDEKRRAAIDRLAAAPPRWERWVTAILALGGALCALAAGLLAVW